MAVVLSLNYNANLGNRAVSAAWAARAARVADPMGIPGVSGWVLLAKAATCVDPHQAQDLAREAQRLAVEADDRDLELCALSSLTGTMGYAFSTMHCMTVSLSLGGDGLGTFWGGQTARQMLDAAGFGLVEVVEVEADFVNDYFIARKG